MDNLTYIYMNIENFSKKRLTNIAFTVKITSVSLN